MIKNHRRKASNFPASNGMEITAKSIEETEKLAADFTRQLEDSPTKQGAEIILLEGDLGSGKTAFTKALAKAFGVSDTVTSPTFILEKVYQIKSERFSRLIHIDAYRFENPGEANVLNLKLLFNDPANLIVIEWPERITELLPKDAHKISFAFVDESTRHIHFHPVRDRDRNKQ